MLLLFALLVPASSQQLTGGMLYPRASESRELVSLDGVWDFRASPDNDQSEGFRESWFKKRLAQTGEVQPMPVPSSYNDVTQNASLRDYIGWVWYDREFYIPARWKQDGRVVLRFGSVHYYTMVWVNGISAVNHSGGHLPFEADVTKLLHANCSNLVTVAVNNTLTTYTIPQGETITHPNSSRYPPGFHAQEYSFDFFNYAGIHRPVHLYTTPNTYIEDITVTTEILGETAGVIHYRVDYKSESAEQQVVCYVELFNKKRIMVGTAKGCKSLVKVANATFWWPFQMSEEPGYLYTLKVNVVSSNGMDVYRLPVGIRYVSWNKTGIYINSRPFYFRGFGRHEDSDIRGKGLDLPLVIKDYNLIKWVGANSYRTSHYPYAEEIMDQADQQGIVIIDECPAVDLSVFDQKMLKNHVHVMTELIQRDKNRPSVVMWSLANEPRSSKKEAKDYFSNLTSVVRSLDHTRIVSLVINADVSTDQALVSYVHQLDSGRPVTAALSGGVSSDNAAAFVDIICVNRYFSWYSDTGHLEVVRRQVVSEYTEWHEKHGKLVMISEYGADTLAGMHMDPPFVWTEDYQVAMMSEYFQAFDELRHAGFFVGEMIWNFADFATAQAVTRVVGNKKGIFTRQRQPKASAHFLRARYHQLAEEIDGFKDLKYRSRVYCPRV